MAFPNEMIRLRADPDVEPLVALLFTVYVSNGYPANWPKDPVRWLAGHRTIGAWVREERGELVGHVSLTLPDASRAWPEWQQATDVHRDRLAVMRRLFVSPDWRGRGVTSSLVDVAERAAATRGLQPVLDVADHNTAAIAFWRNRGWREVGHATLPPGDEGLPVRLVLFVAPGRLRD
jgi:GNAT superfamily N-acetyltransferase